MAERLYLSTVIGDGTPSQLSSPGNPFRPKAFTYPSISSAVIEIPSLPNGHPVKSWVIVVVNATDFTQHDADTDLQLLADAAVLHTVLSAQQISRVNTYFAKVGIVTQASAGDTPTSIINRLLAELGSSVRI